MEPQQQPAPERTPLTDIKLKLVGEDGNAYFILARARKALHRGGRADLVETFTKEATSGDYQNLLATCIRYFNCH